MSTPAWIPEIFAAVMILVAEVSAGQLLIARAWTRRADADIAVSRLLTGIAMAGILLPGLSILPNAAWEAVFAVMTAWFAWCLGRESRERGTAAVARSRYAPHLVQSAAMLYIFAALAGGPVAGIPTLQAPTLALIFALLLVAFTVHDLDQRAGVGRGGPTALRQPTYADAERLLLSPAVVKGCRVTTGVTIAFMLIILI